MEDEGLAQPSPLGSNDSRTDTDNLTGPRQREGGWPLGRAGPLGVEQARKGSVRVGGGSTGSPVVVGGKKQRVSSGEEGAQSPLW